MRTPAAHSFVTASRRARPRSNVPSGRCPAFLATSRKRQSENPSDGFWRNVSTAAAITSGSCSDKWRWFRSIAMAVAIARGGSSYALASTQDASASARCGSHAPLATNASAALTCRESSRVIRRTSTFVSMARKPFPRVPTNTVFKLIEGAGCRWPASKHRVVHVLGAVVTRSPHDNLSRLFLPFKDGSRPHAKLPAHFRGDGDLPLGGDPGADASHAAHITMVMHS